MQAQLRHDDTAEIDLHGLTIFNAETLLIETLDLLPKHIKILDVIHGYSHGTGLKRMVKNDFYHWRLAAKHATLNAGVSRFILK